MIRQLALASALALASPFVVSAARPPAQEVPEVAQVVAGVREAAAAAAPDRAEELAPRQAASAAVTLAAAGPRGDIAAMAQVWQTWNNCGPASVVMALSAMGVDASQEEARLALRGEDVRRGMPAANVDPWVFSRFGLRAIARVNGTAESLKRFVANGLPVLVTQWLEDGSRIAHYRVVRGYDDARGVFLVNDPMRGASVALDYAWFDENWQPFSYRYLVIYRAQDELRAKALIGEDWDDIRMRERLYARASAEAAAQGTAYAWLTYGEAAYQFGRVAEAVAAFERGMALGSASGIFTLRTSYPAALRLLGRDGDARAAQAGLANLTPVPGRAVEPDPVAVQLASSRLAGLDLGRMLAD